MSKKILSILGIILLLAAIVFGTYTFVKRWQNDELLKNPTPAIRVDTGMSKTLYSTTDPSSPWVVVNKKLPLAPVTYEPSDLINVGNNQQLKSPAAKSLALLVKDAEALNLNIIIVNGYRSYSYQGTVYATEVANSSAEIADVSIAKPGYSEHQTGWAIDVNSIDCNTDDYDCFATTAEGSWVGLHAHEYGFIVRYTADNRDKTSYRAEPWHLRYVGTELSMELNNKNIGSMEEFFEL